MQSSTMDIGSYAVTSGQIPGQFEDGCVGSSPQSLSGIVVSRIEGEKVFVSEWHITSHFEGAQTLEQFEEAKLRHDFEFTFSAERELREGEKLEGADPLLKEQLRRKLKSRKVHRH